MHFCFTAATLATNSDAMKTLEYRLQKGLRDNVLFDTGDFVRRVENAYIQMLQQFNEGQSAVDIAVP